MIVRLFIFLSALQLTHSLKAICYGEPGVDLPIRYFFVQLQDDSGVNLTRSSGALSIKAQKYEEACREHSTTIDRGDGSYIARVRPFNACSKLSIKVSIDNQVLCEFDLQNADRSKLKQEECICPDLPKSIDWIDHARCDVEPQLEKDLEKFPTIDFAEVLKAAIERYGAEKYSRTFSICHYAIKNNKVYRKCYGEYVGFKSFADSILLSLTRKMVLPDTQFIMNLGDYPLSYKTKTGQSWLPIISWCGSDETVDIVLPTYSITNSLVNGERYINVHDSLGSDPTPWEYKDEKPIFRGRDSNRLRLQLARMSDERPDLLDAGITRYFFFKKEEHSPPRDAVSFKDFFKHRYVISVDGTVAAYRLPSLMSGDSVILKSDSQHYEHFYSRMEPYVHYIPFNGDNVEEVIKWTKEHDMNKTISSMKQFFIDHLQPRNLYCYYARFFEAYSNRVVDGVNLSIDGMEEVSQEGRRDCECGSRSTVAAPRSDEL